MLEPYSCSCRQLCVAGGLQWRSRCLSNLGPAGCGRSQNPSALRACGRARGEGVRQGGQAARWDLAAPVLGPLPLEGCRVCSACAVPHLGVACQCAACWGVVFAIWECQKELLLRGPLWKVPFLYAPQETRRCQTSRWGDGKLCHVAPHSLKKREWQGCAQICSSVGGFTCQQLLGGP